MRAPVENGERREELARAPLASLVPQHRARYITRAPATQATINVASRTFTVTLKPIPTTEYAS